ncbi:MAG: UDP-2,3-diacylglucosamine diphosphatase [Sphingobacteriales bacterium]|nr:UDP-2,3-diacylglucosamine diphosphatase [Sphingobacteriales bacterium]
MNRTKYYFASDFHLGAPKYQSSKAREQKIVAWLEAIKTDAAALFLMGDVFDFWFEYKTVIPKGYVRLLGKLAELSDTGVKLYFFKGNHDMWVFDYFEKELNATIISDELIIEKDGKRVFLHHGDGLGKGDEAYKLLKKIFRSQFCQWLFARLHPNLGIGIANYWSGKSRIANNKKEGLKLIESEKIWAESYYQELKQEFGDFDFVIFGHRHFPVKIHLSSGATYFNLGEWVNYTYYAMMDNGKVELLDFKPDEK